VRQGRIQSALEDVTTLFKLAHHAKEPFLIASLIAGSIDTLAVKCLEDVLNNASQEAKDLSQLSVPEASFRNAFRRGVLMEQAVFGLMFFSALSLSDDEWARTGLKKTGPISLFVSSPFYRVFLLADDAAAYQKYTKNYEGLAQSPFWTDKNYWDRADEFKKENHGGLFTALFLSDMAKVRKIAAKSDAYHRLAQLALAVEAYRQKHHSLPERLDELAPAFLPAIPLDPFDGQPLRFKRDGNDVMLYSIGPDDVDDGGIPWNETAKKGDLVFRIKGR
jgi:hypothetical protein